MNTYWKDVPKNAEVKLIGHAYHYDDGIVYWMGEEESEAVMFLDRIAVKVPVN